MSGKRAERTYTNAEVVERLKRDLPHWTHASGYIVRRTGRTAGRAR